jgi:two-component system cell cycle response regulator
MDFDSFLNLNDCPNILILDIQIPDMDGVEICRLIKAKPELSGIKVIVITGFPDSTKAKEIVDMGFKNILPKPFRLTDLLGSVEMVLKGEQSDLA